MSVFALIALPLKDKREKTYSAPLATHLFAKETVEMPDGTEARGFPRLMHGGAHLKDPERDRSPDIVKRAIAGLAIAAIAWNVPLLSLPLRFSHRPSHTL